MQAGDYTAVHNQLPGIIQCSDTDKLDIHSANYYMNEQSDGFVRVSTGNDAQDAKYQDANKRAKGETTNPRLWPLLG